MARPDAAARARPAQVVAGAGRRAALDRAYRAARLAPANREARLLLASLLVETPRRDLVWRHLRRAAQGMPVDWAGATTLGELLFLIGDFDRAYRVLAACLERGQIDDAALKTLSALQEHRGEKLAARRSLAASAWLRPVEAPAQVDPDKPNILRIRSVERSKFTIHQKKRWQTYGRRMRYGHFSSSNLLDRSRCNLFVANFCGENMSLTEELPDFRLAINSVSCPDLLPESLIQIERFLARFPEVPVINPPAKVLETTRARNYERLGGIDGVRFPRTALVANDAPAEALADRIEGLGFGYPMILRRAGTQTGQSMGKVESRAQAIERLASAQPGADLYAIEYIDCRAPDGFYHKTRVFFIDRVLYQVANLTNDTWQIHSGDRYRVMSTTPATQEDEKTFLRDPEAYLGPRAWKALHEICRVIDLDFFGIDFTRTPDGGVLVFEANAAMRHNFDHAGNFPYTRPHLERVSAAFQRMVADRLAGGAR